MMTALLPAIMQGVKTLGGVIATKSKATAETTARVADRLAARADWLIAVVFLVWALPLGHAFMNPEEADRLARILTEFPAWYVEGFTQISYGAAGAAAVMRMLKR